jgi:hypothetical protein
LLTIMPKAVTVAPSTQQTYIFTITGGTPPYNIVSSNPTDVYFGSAGTGTSSSAPYTATVPVWAAPGLVTLTVTDGAGSVRTATITILATPRIEPSATSMSSATGGAINFTISHGKANYSVTSSNASQVYFNTVGTGSLIGVPSTFIGTIPMGAPQGATTITVTGEDGASNSVTITIGP